MDESLRVAVVEDQPLFCSMLVTLLRSQAGIATVFSAGDVKTAREVIRPGGADVAVLDIHLPDGNGMELGLALRKTDPELGIVLLSSLDIMDSLLSLPAGKRRGWSYLSKTSTTSTVSLMRAIRSSAAGGTMLDPDLVQRSVPRAGSPIGGLTPRQLHALRLLAQGFSNGAIAQELSISPHSVDNLLNALYFALGLQAEPGRNSRVSAVLKFLEGTARAA